MKIAAIIFICGLLLIGYGLTLPAFTDEDLFHEEVTRISDEASESGANSRDDQFYELRKKMVTPKYDLINAGGTFVVTAFLIALMVRKGKLQVLLTGSRMVLIAMAFALPFLTVVGMAFATFLDPDLSITPPWEPWDDAAERSFAVLAPELLVIMLIWSFMHVFIFSRSRQPAKILSFTLISTANVWLMINSAFAIFLIMLFAMATMYWLYAISCAWAYFYLSLAASRQGINP